MTRVGRRSSAGQMDERMLLLTEKEVQALWRLLLDFGAYAEDKDVRDRLVRKLAAPYRIRDLGVQDALPHSASVPARAPKPA